MQLSKAQRRVESLNKVVPNGVEISYHVHGDISKPNDALIVQYYNGKPVGIAAY